MFDNYEDACEAELTRDAAKKEIANHSLEFKDFLNDVGYKEIYSGKEVLDWLGY